MSMWLLICVAVRSRTPPGPNTSLATMPTGYFGGNSGVRGAAQIAALAQQRLIVIAKWRVYRKRRSKRADDSAER